MGDLSSHYILFTYSWEFIKTEEVQKYFYLNHVLEGSSLRGDKTADSVGRLTVKCRDLWPFTLAIDQLNQGLTPHSTLNRSFWRCSSWLTLRKEGLAVASIARDVVV